MLSSRDEIDGAIAGETDIGPALAQQTLIGLDWGTSRCRAYLFGSGGNVLAQIDEPLGIMAVAASGSGSIQDRFSEIFERLCGSWLRANPDLPVIAAGMVGSRQGWAEAPYRILPADLADPHPPSVIAHTRAGLAVHIIPGLLDMHGMRGVMRGEETQLLGALREQEESTGEDLSNRDQVMVLPGTHSKWVATRGTVVTRFTTFMTGELHQLLLSESVLGSLAEESPQPRWEAFARGVAVAAGEDGHAGLLNTIFSARSLPLTGAMAKTDVPDYLSGLLIGAELVGARRDWLSGLTQVITLVGEPSLCQRYQRAGTLLDWPVLGHVPAAAAKGLWQFAATMGLITRGPRHP